MARGNRTGRRGRGPEGEIRREFKLRADPGLLERAERASDDGGHRSLNEWIVEAIEMRLRAGG
jgi:predicted HicB family RNase H-like nuclease